MNEVTRLLEQLEINFRGDSWHGPPLMQLLSDIPAERAAARPIPNAHSIWELVLHIQTWKDVPRRRLEDEVFEPTDEEDWPKVKDSSEAAWEQTLRDVESSHKKLVQTVSKLNDAKLEDIVPGNDYSNNFMIHGVIQHDLYHAGQIALLKKMR